MMGDFEKAVLLVFKHEGGYVNNPADTPTNFGITQAVLAKWRATPVTAKDVQLLTQDEAKRIYKAQYWNAIRGDAIKCSDTAMYFFDMAVLRGVTAAVKTMQAALGITTDGNFGPASVKALNDASCASVLADFQTMCINRFLEIVDANVSKLQFLHGWITRALEMSRVIAKLNALP